MSQAASPAAGLGRTFGQHRTKVRVPAACSQDFEPQVLFIAQSAGAPLLRGQLLWRSNDRAGGSAGGKSAFEPGRHMSLWTGWGDYHSQRLHSALIANSLMSGHHLRRPFAARRVPPALGTHRTSRAQMGPMETGPVADPLRCRKPGSLGSVAHEVYWHLRLTARTAASAHLSASALRRQDQPQPRSKRPRNATQRHFPLLLDIRRAAPPHARGQSSC
jgi:hypothetical protein